MTEKDFKKIVNDQESVQNNKTILNNLKEEFINCINQYLLDGIKIVDTRLSDWCLLGIYTNTNTIYLSIDVDTNVVNKQYESNLIINSIENALYLLNATRVERINNGLKCSYLDKEFVLELKSDYLTPVSYLNCVLKIVEEKAKNYTLLKNSLSIVNYFINSEDIKDLNVIFLINLFIKALDKEVVENKYYKYLTYYSKALDDFTNNKKFEINDLVVSDSFMNLNLTEAKISEYRRLRKALVKAVSVETVEVKFDSNLEVVVDVNPIFNEATKTFAWHYSLIGKNQENSGGVYSNNEVEYQTAILKGVFKGLRAVIDANLVKKRIILKCDYEGILSSKMLTSDENKSRMKTINSLIINNDLKIKEM